MTTARTTEEIQENVNRYKGAITRDKILESLNQISKDDIIPMTAPAEARVMIGAEGMAIRPRKGARVIEVEPDGGVKELQRFAGLSPAVANLLFPKTFEQVLTEILQHKDKYALVVRDQRVSNIVRLNKIGLQMKPEKTLSTIEKVIPVVGYNRLLVDNGMATVEIVGDRTAPVMRGDLVQAGIRLTFDPRGFNEPSIQGYALRLECTNGMTSNIGFSEYRFGGGGDAGGHGDDNADVYRWLRKSTKDSYNALHEMVEQWKLLAEEAVTDDRRALMIEAAMKAAGITGEHAKTILNMAIQNPPQNAWDIHNLITYATSHLLEEPKRINKALNAAADYADQSAHAAICPVCRHSR